MGGKNASHVPKLISFNLYVSKRFSIGTGSNIGLMEHRDLMMKSQISARGRL